MIVLRQCKVIDDRLFSPCSPNCIEFHIYKTMHSENGFYSLKEDCFYKHNIINTLNSFSIFPFVAVIPKGSYFYHGHGENISSSLVLLKKFNSVEDYHFIKKYIDRINRKN